MVLVLEQVLLPLGDVPPEARLNTVIYYLRNNEIEAAFKLIEAMEPSTPQEYILKVVFSAPTQTPVAQTTSANSLRLAHSCADSYTMGAVDEMR